MTPTPGEYLVGAYLKIIEKCNFIGYNVRPPGGGISGLEELDVIGLNFKSKTAYICEVTTHIRGLQYGDNRATVERIVAKHKRQLKYARSQLKDFENLRFMLWSPVVPVGYQTEHLEMIKGLELVINEAYTARIAALRSKAKKLTNDEGNPAFRVLQILEHLRD